MLALALIAVASPDLTLTWTTGQHDKSSELTSSYQDWESSFQWIVHDNVLMRTVLQVDMRGENPGKAPPLFPSPGVPEPKSTVQLTADEQAKIDALLAACDRFTSVKNDKAKKNAPFTVVTLTHGPKKKTVTVRYNAEVTGTPTDDPANHAAAFAALRALNSYFDSLLR